VLLAAGAIRLVYLVSTLVRPELRDLLILDSRAYVEMASVIAAGDLLAGSEAYFHGPLYAYYLALFHALFGPQTGPVYLSQQLLGLASVALTALIARRCFDTRAALGAAILIAGYGAMAMLELKVMASSLAVFLSLASLLSLLAARDLDWKLGALMPGIALGLACLARPNSLLFAPLAGVWLLWDGQRFRAPGRRLEPGRLPTALAFALGVVLAIAPAAIRNYAVSGDFIPISAQGGATFYQANSETARGLYSRIPEAVGNPRVLREAQVTIAEKAMGSELTPTEVSSYWMQRGLEELARNPARAVALFANKLRFWLGNDEISTEYVLPSERILVPALWLMPVPFAIVLGLGVLGLRETGFGSPKRVLLQLFILSNLASVLLFYFSSRYRLPAVPVLAVFAGAGAAAIAERWRQPPRRLALWLLPGVIVTALSLVSWSQDYRQAAAQQFFNYGTVYYERGLYGEAVESYRLALPALRGKWQLHFYLASALSRLEKPRAAIHHFELALQLEPKAHAVRKALQLERLELRKLEGGR